MDDNKDFIEAREYLVGSCMMTADGALETVMQSRIGRLPTQKELDEFAEFLDQHSTYECEICGWWHDDGDYICDECLADQEEQENERDSDD
jgi:hypothetical protein